MKKSIAPQDNLLPEALSAAARAMARDIMLRLVDTNAVFEAGAVARRQTGLTLWAEGVSMYGGATGIAMAFAHAARVLDMDVDDWYLSSRRWLRQAAVGTHQVPVASAGVGDGTAGLALVLSDLATRDGRYINALRTLHGRLAEQVSELVRLPAGPLYFGVYDTIAGWAGILGSVISTSSIGPSMRRCTYELIEQLVRTCAIGEDADPWAPWRIPKENHPLRDAGLYPFGYVDLGLAHGLPGPMAALSRAWVAGYRRSGMREAIHGLATQIMSVAQTDEWGPCWPRVMPFDESGAVAPHLAVISRPTYCYGSPGICSALLDAADALADDSIRAVAFKGFEAALQRIDAERGMLVFPGLCHGIAGLILICWKFAIRGGSDLAKAMLATLTEDLLSRCDPRLPFLVQDYRPPNPGAGKLVDLSNGIWIDNPWLLEGAAGVALTLMSVSSPVPPRWARALLVE